MLKKVVKHKMPYIGNGIPFAFLAFLAFLAYVHPSHTANSKYKFFMNDQLNVDVLVNYLKLTVYKLQLSAKK